MPLGIAISVGGVADAQLSEAAQAVVEEGMMMSTRFQIVYPADIADGEIPLLSDSRLDPGSELSIIADSPGGAQCLVKGPVTGQLARLAHGGGSSSVEVRGADTSFAMDRENKATVWADVTDSEAVSTILAGYGYIPDVESTAARHLELKHALVQRGTDLAFVRMLARRNGAQFWISCDPLGIETAHFRRPDTARTPDRTLAINQDPPSVTEMEIEWDLAAASSAVSQGVDPASKSVLSGDVAASPLAPLGAQPLSALPPGPAGLHIAPPADDAGDLTARAEAVLIEEGWFLRARCTTSVQAAGGIVRPHGVVALSGLGARHSGNYYVASVRHRIDAEAHRMELELIRNAWGS
jgi:phage protein D